MNSKTFIIVLKQIGSLLILLGLIVGIPTIVSIGYSEWYPAAGFLLAALITSGAGYAIQRLFYRAEEPQYNHALVIAASGWLAITMMGGLPFFIIEHGKIDKV